MLFILFYVNFILVEIVFLRKIETMISIIFDLLRSLIF